MGVKQSTEQGGQPKTDPQTNLFFITNQAVQDRREDVEPRIFHYDYSLLPLSESQRMLLNEISAIAPITEWRLLKRYSPRYNQRYVLARIIRLWEKCLLAVVYDGSREGARIHVANLLVRPGEIWAMPNGKLIAWREGEMWHIMEEWAAIRGRKPITFALPHEVLKAAELPRKLYVAATYKKRKSSCLGFDAHYLVAVPSAEMAETIEAQMAIANLGEA